MDAPARPRGQLRLRERTAESISEYTGLNSGEVALILLDRLDVLVRTGATWQDILHRLTPQVAAHRCPVCRQAGYDPRHDNTH